MAMLKLCACGKPIDLSQAKCDACLAIKGERHKLYDKYRRDKESAKFYSSGDWQLLRAQALQRDAGLCVHCLRDEMITFATEVDHVLPIKHYWQYRLKLDNLQSLCRHCHRTKTEEDKQRFGN